jgi:hypothetical protein
MRRILFLFALALAAVAARSDAAIKARNASRVTVGDCTSAGTQTILLYAFDTTVLQDFADDLAELYGYPTIVCQSADVTAGRCTSGQIGQAVTTPESKNAFANWMLSEEFRRRIHNRRKRLAASAAEAGATQPGAIE